MRASVLTHPVVLLCCCLHQALERFIPDVRTRTELCMVGTPLTHERFLRRHRGSYGEHALLARRARLP